MKSHFVVDLTDGQSVSSLFLVREKEVRTSSRTGTSWLQLELADRTGAISAKMWDNFAPLLPTFERDDVVLVRGRVKLYNGQKEMAIEQIIPSAESDYDLGDFLPRTRHDVEEMYAKLRSAVASVQNPWLKRLIESVAEDPAIVPRLKRAPAAMAMHHAFLGGLLEHIVSLAGLSAALCRHYPELDSDLMLSGVVLHDIGKIEELQYARGIGYSTEGRLLGHISIGLMLVRGKIQALPGFPPPLAVLIEHLILSHHGTHEFGSPALPQTREAVALHFLDDVDSKMAAMRATLEFHAVAPDESPWTDRNPALRRALLRAEKFLGNGSKEEQETGTKGATSKPSVNNAAGKDARPVPHE